MSEYERLIELINQAFNQADDNYGMPNAEQVADYLLENGVSVPPVKVGQTVYGISRDVIVPIIVDKIIYSNNGIDFLGRNEQYFGRSFIHIDINNGFGIEWYKSKEEAEKVMKGGAK